MHLMSLTRELNSQNQDSEVDCDHNFLRPQGNEIVTNIISLMYYKYVYFKRNGTV